MPYTMEKITSGKNKGKYRVINKSTRKVHAKATSKIRAQRQMNLLRGVEHGFQPTGKKASK